MTVISCILVEWAPGREKTARWRLKSEMCSNMEIVHHYFHQVYKKINKYIYMLSDVHTGTEKILQIHERLSIIPTMIIKTQPSNNNEANCLWWHANLFGCGTCWIPEPVEEMMKSLGSGVKHPPVYTTQTRWPDSFALWNKKRIRFVFGRLSLCWNNSYWQYVWSRLKSC